MIKNTLMELIEEYGRTVEPQDDIRFTETMDIIKGSGSKSEMVENGYLYGCMCTANGDTRRRVPIYNIRQITDDEWNALAAAQKRGGKHEQ